MLRRELCGGLSSWLISAGSASNPAFAWGDVAHRIICEIAYEELRSEIKARVDALVAIDPKFRTFADGCTWPDVFPRRGGPSIMWTFPLSERR